MDTESHSVLHTPAYNMHLIFTRFYLTKKTHKKNSVPSILLREFGQLTQKLVGSIMTTYRANIAKIVPIGNPK